MILHQQGQSSLAGCLGAAGTKAEEDALEAALVPVVEEGVPALVLEQLRLLRALRCRGGDVIAAWEALPLECLLMLLSASPRAQAALQGPGGGHDGMLVGPQSLCWCEV